VIVADLLVIGVAALVTVESLATQRAAAAVNAQNMARLLETGLAASLDRIDLALQAVAGEHRRAAAGGPVDGAALEAFMAQQKARTPDLLALRLAGPDGVLRFNVPPAPPTNTVADREFFVRLRQSPAAGPVVSHPFHGRIIQTPVLVVARALETPGGGFDGVVLGTVELAHLEQLISAVEVGAHGALSLRYEDHSLVVAKGVGDAAPLGERVGSGQRATFVPAGPADEVYRAGAGRGERTVAFRRFERYPLYVVVSLSPEEYLGGWRRQTAVLWLLVTGFLVFTLGGARYGVAAWRRRLEFERLLVEGTAHLRESNEHLRESEERFRTAFLTSPDSVNLNRVADGVYVAINEGFTRMTGFTEAEVVGRSSVALGIWTDPADRALLVAGLERDGYVENLEARFRRKDGSVLVGLMSARLVTLNGEQLLLSITRDVTAWKDAEAQRDRLQVQFQQAQRLEGLGRLAGGVAHDFNNLLTVILGSLEVVRPRVADDVREDLDQIDVAAGRARDLTRQLLAFARKQVIAPVALDLAGVVRDSERLLRRVLGEDVALTVDLGEPLWPVLCDPAQLQQVILNLVVNARDAMPEGGTLAIAVRNAERSGAAAGDAGGEGGSPGEWVRLSVRDSGVGMGPEVQAHLFEPFFTTKPWGKGTGLGLATVHGIVAQSGGLIEVESAPGRGTTIAVLLPRAAEGPGAVPSAPPAPAPAPGSGTILVVEDEPLVRNVTVRGLRAAGYEVLVAGSGEEALATAERHGARLDLVVSDVIMPGLSGPQVVEQLRRARPGLRALYVSGYPQDAIAHRGVDLGVEFLPKPFSAAALLERVRGLIGPRAASGEPRRTR
jgi:PAS domain S-box-containing protein